MKIDLATQKIPYQELSESPVLFLWCGLRLSGPFHLAEDTI